ncbi:unnamed protein product, partial [Adineta steineri]
MFSSSLTPNSSIYFQDCLEFDSYYEAIQMNINMTGYYIFLINSDMKTVYAYIYTNNFNPFDVSKNVLSHNGDYESRGEFQLRAFLQANMKYIFVMTTSSSNVTGNISIRISGLSYIGFNRICSPSAMQKPYLSAVRSTYSLQLTTNSQTYSRDCRKSNYYYETMRVNVMETGYYALSSDSRKIISDDNSMDIFEASSMGPFAQIPTSCFIGQKCQFYKKSIGVILDDILRDEIRTNMTLTDQTILMKINAALTMIMFVGGLINSILSILTFKNKDLRQVGCGIYLLASSITSFLTITMFTVKFWFVVLTQMKLSIRLSVVRGGCVSIEPLLKLCLYLDAWLNACVAVERAILVFKGVNFNKQKSQRIAQWIILILPFC